VEDTDDRNPDVGVHALIFETPNLLGERAAQAYTDSARWFPDMADDIPLTALCLAGEVGEAANLIKKVARGTHTWEEVFHLLTSEIVDVQTYLFKLMGQLSRMAEAEGSKWTWDELYDLKRAYNEERFGRGSQSAD